MIWGSLPPAKGVPLLSATHVEYASLGVSWVHKLSGMAGSLSPTNEIYLRPGARVVVELDREGVMVAYLYDPPAPADPEEVFCNEEIGR